MTPNEQARLWRESRNLTRKQLGEMIGYNAQTIYWLERGAAPPGKGSNGQIAPQVWLRYQRACQGLDAELRLGERKPEEWPW